MRDGPRLVVDHEHRVQLRVEPLVDEHLDGDPAVGEGRGRHARRDGRRADRGSTLQAVEIHLALREQEEVAVTRVAHVERTAARPPEPRRERTCRFHRAWPRRDHLDPERTPVPAPRMGDADGHDTACARLELDPAPVEVQHRVPFEDVEALLVRMDVRAEVSVRQRAQGQRHVGRAGGAVDEATGFEAASVARVEIGERHVLAPDEAMPRSAVRELSRPGIAVMWRATAAAESRAVFTARLRSIASTPSPRRRFASG